jgi:rRNA maturation endonuclease Nob1
MKQLHTLALFAALVFAHTTPASAADINEESVNAFYNESTLSFKLPYDEYYKKTDEMTAPEFVGTTKLTLTMPGQAPVEQNIRKTKTEMMSEAAEGYAGMKSAKLSYEVKAIKIAPDKQSADVSTVLMIKDMSVQNVPASMGLSSTGICNDRLVATPTGVKISASVCDVRAVVGQKS